MKSWVFDYMVDLKQIRENIDLYKNAVKVKRLDADIEALLKADDKRLELLKEVEDLNRQRNEAAKNRDIEKGRELKEKADKIEGAFKLAEEELNLLLVKVPTPPSSDTPVGKDDSENKEIYQWGEIPKFNFEVKDHVQLGKELDILDLERGAKVGGYRGYYLKNEGVMLVMGIMMYALHKMVSKEYSPMIPPTLVKEFALFGSGYFKGVNYDPSIDEIYQIASGDVDVSGDKEANQKFLVGTAEPSLLAYYSGETLKNDQLPLKLCGYSQCYRSEIGSYGRDTKGMYRVHEFMKVEQVVLCDQDEELAKKLQDEMVSISREMHEELGLPYRQLIICTGDLSTGKYRQYDMEAWLPGLQRWGETGSASIFLDWQSRRLNVKYETKEGKKDFVYMLNNTALPSPRVFIAILENFQQKDGSVKIPEVLVPFTGFSEIKPKR
jgi:seryl-tRNA synthetase